MKRRRTVQQDRMLADYFLEDVPYFWPLLLDHALGRLNRTREAINVQLRIDKRLKQLKCHLLWQTALLQLEFGADHDDGAARIVDPRAEQVLAEPALLALQHVGERFQRPLVGPGDDSSSPTLVKQCVDGFLEHALLVSHDDVGRFKLNQPFQPIVAVDNAAGEILEARGRKPAAA